VLIGDSAVRHNSFFVTLAFLAGLGIGVFARTAATAASRQNDTHAADLAAIEKLHRADEECTLTQDPECLTKLWSDDGVNVDVPGAPVVGIKALGVMYVKFRAQYPEFKVLKYAPDYKDMQTAIVDSWAIEVGANTDVVYKMFANAAAINVPRTRGMRLLKRQPDGSWKFLLCCMK
jgi:hypothetical protein